MYDLAGGVLYVWCALKAGVIPGGRQKGEGTFTFATL